MLRDVSDSVDDEFNDLCIYGWIKCYSLWISTNWILIVIGGYSVLRYVVTIVAVINTIIAGKLF